MKNIKSFLIALSSLVILGATSALASSPIPETHTMDVFVEIAGAPPVVWNTVNGVSYVIFGYHVGRATGFNRKPSVRKNFSVVFSDYDGALAYLNTLPNPVVTPMSSELAR